MTGSFNDIEELVEAHLDNLEILELSNVTMDFYVRETFALAANSFQYGSIEEAFNKSSHQNIAGPALYYAQTIQKIVRDHPQTNQSEVQKAVVTLIERSDRPIAKTYTQAMRNFVADMGL